MTTAIEVRDLTKTFRVPHHRVDSLKERLLHPFDQGGYDDLHALREVSFDVGSGEFFGVVGRNGSGKSTLLKILASIYGASSGRIRMAGTLAPFIELGVGFNMDLTARENIVLNGVMMGLTREEAGNRIDSVLAFAELEEHVELKLKNYSSGMLVRLAFSVMLEADTDILLIDEVLAVGDASFQQKCTDAFDQMRDSGRTVLLVTHDMRAVERFCDRAMLLEAGRIEALGDPSEISRRYLQLNFDDSIAEESRNGASQGAGRRGAPEVTLSRTWLETAEGNPTTTIEEGEEFSLHAILEVNRDVPRPYIGFVFSDPNGIDIIGVGQGLEDLESVPETLRAGQRIQFTARLRNRLANGRYEAACWVHRDSSFAEAIVVVPGAVDFVVYGADINCLIGVDYEVDILIDEGRP